MRNIEFLKILSLPNILKWRKVTGLKDPQLNNTTLVLETAAILFLDR